MDFGDIGMFLRIIREELNISQETAAAVVNVSDRTIRNIETGHTISDPRTLFKLCDLYHISGTELWLFYERDDDMEDAIRAYHIPREREPDVK